MIRLFKDVQYKRDLNVIELTGVIKNLPDYCKYIPRPLISFDLDSYRRRKSEEEEWRVDENRIVVFDDEEFHEKFSNGDRIRIKGELQSRNYTRDTYEVDELIKFAVTNYVDIWGSYPTKKEPKGNKRQLIEWSKLIEATLLETVPEDSIFDEFGNKNREAEYVYRVDVNGDVFKETQHVAYEIVATSIVKVEEELDSLLGDYNKAVILGRITKEPFFDFIGKDTPIPFCSLNIGTKSAFFEERMFFNNIITWSKLAETIFNNFHKDDYIKIVGRIQSRTFEKEFVKRWKTPSGKRKKKSKMFTLMTREISATKAQRVIIEEELPEKENDTKDE